jgi:hypothetical protein
MKTGIELISEEREEQLTKHGKTARHDDSHENEDLLKAAKYAIEPCEQYFKEMDIGWSHFAAKIDAKTPIERLKVAGALIAAEIDRLLREELRTEE